MKRILATVTLLSEMTGFADLDAWLTRPRPAPQRLLSPRREPQGARLCASREQAAEAPKSDGRYEASTVPAIPDAQMAA